MVTLCTSVACVLRKDEFKFGKGFEGDWTAAEFKGQKGMGSGLVGGDGINKTAIMNSMFVKPAFVASPSLSNGKQLSL